MRTRLALLAAFVLVSLAALSASRSLGHERTSGLFPTDPTTPYSRISPEGNPVGKILFVHGLHANRRMARSIGTAFADGGFEVYLIDLPGHGDSTAPLRFDDGVRVVRSIAESLGPDTVLAGHSMGGAIAARVAGERHVPTMVLYSPAPIALSRLNVDRLLIITGEYDPAAINDRARYLMDLAGKRTAWWRYRGLGHSGALFRPYVQEAAVRWLGGEPERVESTKRYFLLGVSFAAAIAAFRTLTSRGRREKNITSRRRLPGVIAEYILAVGVGVAVVWWTNPLGGLGIYALDYVLAIVLISGLVLWRTPRFGLSLEGSGMALGGAAFFVGLGFVIVGAEVTDTLPRAADWWRVPLVSIAVLPLALRDECEFRRTGSAWTTTAAFVATRGIIGAAVLTGVQLWNREAAFLVLGTHLILAFWLALWWLSGMVRRWTGEPGAAALFSALVQGWIFTAVSVTI